MIDFRLAAGVALIAGAAVLTGCVSTSPYDRTTTSEQSSTTTHAPQSTTTTTTSQQNSQRP